MQPSNGAGFKAKQDQSIDETRDARTWKNESRAKRGFYRKFDINRFIDTTNISDSTRPERLFSPHSAQRISVRTLR